MLAVALIVLATALLGAVTDAVVESAIDGGDSVVMFGRTLVSPGVAGTLGILTAVSAIAVLAWAAAIAHVRGRRLERRLTEELDERWEDLSQRVAGELGRKTLLEWRVAELRTQVDELVVKRDELLDEMNAVRERTSELQRVIRRQREAAAAEAGVAAAATAAAKDEVEAAAAAAGEAEVTVATVEAEVASASSGSSDEPADEVVVLPEASEPSEAPDAGSEGSVTDVGEPEPAGVPGEQADEQGPNDTRDPWR